MDERRPGGDLDRVAAQRQDLRDLRAATDIRQSLLSGTPEHDEALRREDELIERIRAWAEDRPA